MTQLVGAQSPLSSPRRRGSSWRAPAVISAVKRLEQVIPARIALLDQPQFPAPLPFLERLLAGDGVADIGIRFDVDQPRHAIFFGKSRTPAVSMRGDAGGKIAGDADIKRPVPLAGENIDMINARHGLF